MPPRPGTCRWLPLQRSRHEAPTGRASLRVVHGVRRRQTQGACSCLALALWWRVLCRRDQAPACGCLCNGAAMRVRLTANSHECIIWCISEVWGAVSVRRRLHAKCGPRVNVGVMRPQSRWATSRESGAGPRAPRTAAAAASGSARYDGRGSTRSLKTRRLKVTCPYQPPF